MKFERNILLISVAALVSACSGQGQQKIISPQPVANVLAQQAQQAADTSNPQNNTSSSTSATLKPSYADALFCPTVKQCDDQCAGKDLKEAPAWCPKCNGLIVSSDNQTTCSDQFAGLEMGSDGLPAIVSPYGLSTRTSMGTYPGWRTPNQLQPGGFRNPMGPGFASMSNGYTYPGFCHQNIGVGCDAGPNMTMFIPTRRVITCLTNAANAPTPVAAKDAFYQLRKEDIQALPPEAQQSVAQVGRSIGLKDELKSMGFGALDTLIGAGLSVVSAPITRANSYVNFQNGINKAQMITTQNQLDAISLMPQGITVQQVCSGQAGVNSQYQQAACPPPCCTY